MSKWLVIYANAEFVVMAETLHDAKIEADKKARDYGIKRGANFEMYRLEVAEDGKC